jgi:lysylphosphatidylglycerol synthetase-like protein (DUF2156 family)
LKCPTCGRKYEGVAVFCPGCGRRLQEGQGVAAVPYQVPTEEQEKLEHERSLYIKLTLIPIGAVIIANIILVALTTSSHRTQGSMVAVNLIRAFILLPGVGVMIYAAIRFGMFMEFTALEWVFAILLVLFCSLLSILYMLLKANSFGKKSVKVGRIYEEEERGTG